MLARARTHKQADKRHGLGTLTFGVGEAPPASTYTYTGESRDQAREARKASGWATSTYAGEFCDGCMHGQGVWTWSDGRRFEGLFQEDVPVEGVIKSQVVAGW